MKILRKNKLIICLLLAVVVFSVCLISTIPTTAFAEEVEQPLPTKSPEEVSFWENPGKYISNSITGAIESVFLFLTIQMCGLIDLIIGLFAKLVGLDMVNIGDGEQNILTYFLQNEGIKKALMWITIIGFVLLFAFTAVQVVKGMQNSEDEKLHPKKTMENFFKAFINIMLVPVILIVLISTSNVVMQQINTSLQSSMFGDGETEISYGGQIALMMAKDNKGKLQLLDVPEWKNYGKDGFKDEHYFTTSGQPQASITEMGPNSIIKSDGIYPAFKYLNMDNWNADKGGCYGIPTSNLNIFVGFAGALALLAILILCSFTFVKRLFDVILLYLVSPLMIATQPLDEGKRFAYWRDMTISKVLSAYGITIVINLYFMIVPVITINPGVTFFGGVQNSVANGIVQLLFVIGGAFALNGANLLFSQLLGSGTMESQQGMGTAFALSNMLRMGAGIGMAGLGLAKKVGGGTLKHGLGVALGGGGYIGRSMLGTTTAQGIGAWAGKIKGSKTIDNSNVGAPSSAQSSPAMSGTNVGISSSGNNGINANSKNVLGGREANSLPGSKTLTATGTGQMSTTNDKGGSNNYLGNDSSPARSTANNDLTREQKRANKVESRARGERGSINENLNVARMIGRDAGGIMKGGIYGAKSTVKNNWSRMKNENAISKGMKTMDSKISDYASKSLSNKELWGK